MKTLALHPVGGAAGTLRLPGSKSISNRSLLLAALAAGRTRVADLLDSDDTRVMLAALKALGIGLAQEGADWLVDGADGAFPGREADLFMGNAGTAIRPLTAALAMSGGHYRLSGVPRMHERPIGDLVDGLIAIGADVRYTGNPGYPPLEIHPARLTLDGPVPVRGNVSSQFLTALLMALPLLARASGKAATIEVVGELISKPYVEITLNLMRRFGIEVARDDWRAFHIPAGAAYASPGSLHVEGDASSASYFLAAGALGGGPLRVDGVGFDSIQGDVKFADALSRMGANLTAGPNWIEVRGFSNDEHPGKLRAIDADFNHIPDAAMTIAVLALFADGPSTLRNIASWRVKETDRIAAMATELRKLGATVEEGADTLRVTPPAQVLPAAIDTYDDHRMAMCFSLAAFGLAPGSAPLIINDPDCVAKTFPEYFTEFARVTLPR
jgi:3-phosphoshikimate 1-carboxyvinyltransferase